MNEVKFNFKKKLREEKMYIKIINRLIKNGYKPIKTTYSFSLTYNRKKYPYTITIRYNTFSN